MLIRGLVLGLCTLLLGAAVSAQPLPPDIRVLIDVSGSMQRNDPDNLRQPALALLARQMPGEARAGIWTFGTNTKNQVALAPVDSAWREQVLAAREAIDSQALYTDIPGALRAAANDTRQPGRRSIILLTDGMVDVSRSAAEDEAAREGLLREILPELRRDGFALHTIALSENADRELLERLALDTGGAFAVARSAEELERIFLAALDAAAPPQQLPLSGRSFLVDSSVNEFTALVYREPESAPTTLTSPNGTRYSATDHGERVRWRATENYDLITVEQPYEGEWHLATAPEPGSRVTIVSDLNLSVEPLPASLFAGAELALQARLLADGEILDNDELLRLIDVELEAVRLDDDRRWREGLAPQGGEAVYRGALPMLADAGRYRLQVHVDGKTFQRSYRQEMTVRAPFRLQASTLEEPGSEGLPVHELKLTQLSPDWVSDSVRAVARVRSPDGGYSEVLAPAGERRWEIRLDDWQEPGAYSVYLELSGLGEDGAPRNWRSERLQFEQDPVTAPTAKAAPEPDPASEADPEPEAPPEPAAPAAQSEQGPGDDELPVWVWVSALVVGNVLLIALLWLVWRGMQGTRGTDSGLPEDEDDLDTEQAEEALDEEAAEEGAGAVEGDNETRKSGAAPSPQPGGEVGLDDSLDSLDEPLDLPEDTIDIDPDSDRDKPR